MLSSKAGESFEPWCRDTGGVWNIGTQWAEGYETVPEDGDKDVQVWYTGDKKHAFRWIEGSGQVWKKYPDGRWRLEVN